MLLLLPSRPPTLPARPARPLVRGLHLHTGLATGGQPSRRRSSGLNFALYCPPSPSPTASRLRPPTRRQLVRQPVVSVASRPPAIALAFHLPPPPADRHASLPAALSSRLSLARRPVVSPVACPPSPSSKVTILSGYDKVNVICTWAASSSSSPFATAPATHRRLGGPAARDINAKSLRWL